jgi:hypothetical protein
MKIPSERSELSIFTDDFGNLYFSEKEDKRGSMTKKKEGKKISPEKEDYLSFFKDVLITLAIKNYINNY